MRRSRGFTLIELVMVIVITAVIGTVSVQFIGLSARGAIDTASRQQLANAAAILSAQVSRELRGALPGSIRITGGGRCIEYIPVALASTYLDLPVDEAQAQFSAVSWSSEPMEGRIAVYPLLAANPYDVDQFDSTGVGAVSPMASLAGGPGEVVATLSNPHRFPEHSPSRRFFVVDTPRAICAEGTFAYRYRNYGFVSAASDASTTWAGLKYPQREVLATPLKPGSLDFQYTPPTLRRNGVVSFSHTLTHPENGESMTLDQEVQIRNVP